MSLILCFQRSSRRSFVSLLSSTMRCELRLFSVERLNSVYRCDMSDTFSSVGAHILNGASGTTKSLFFRSFSDFKRKLVLVAAAEAGEPTVLLGGGTPTPLARRPGGASSTVLRAAAGGQPTPLGRRPGGPSLSSLSPSCSSFGCVVIVSAAVSRPT